MQRVPFTLDQAKAMAEKYQYLLGWPFGNGDSTAIISAIVVSPFDQVNKKKFLLYYILQDDAGKALIEEYRGLLFDVIVIAKTNEEDILHDNIDAWLHKHDADSGVEHTSFVKKGHL